MTHDDGHGDLEEALRAALTRGARPDVEPAALAAFHEARRAAPPTRRRDDWTPVADRRHGRRSLRAVLAGLLASATLGGVALAAGDLPGLLEDRPLPTPAPTADPVPSAPDASVPHSSPARPQPLPRPSRPTPSEAVEPKPDATEPGRKATGKDDKGKENGNGNGPGKGRGADRGAKNGWLKNGRAAQPAEEPEEDPGHAGSARRH
ncbi:hypothetical protein [Streptomyces sp. cmx-4-7]|uniref:hypothetical protein n=1 Tax=Streptomyces sp. cmx-4-7 TaxID=2790939 RepID=UPI0039813A2A